MTFNSSWSSSSSPGSPNPSSDSAIEAHTLPGWRWPEILTLVVENLSQGMKQVERLLPSGHSVQSSITRQNHAAIQPPGHVHSHRSKLIASIHFRRLSSLQTLLACRACAGALLPRPFVYFLGFALLALFRQLATAQHLEGIDSRAEIPVG